MTTKFSIRGPVVLFAASFALMDAQVSNPEIPVENMGRLEIHTTMDRESYLPGEEMRVTLSVVNPTAEALVVPSPFAKAMLQFSLRRRESDGHSHHFGGFHATEFDSLAGIETVSIPAGATLTWRTGESSRKHYLAAPTRPGSFEFQWKYDVRSAPFEVRDATVELIKSAQIGRVLSFPGAPVMHRWIGSVRQGGQSVLCFNTKDEAAGSQAFSAGTLLSENLEFARGLRRIAVSPPTGGLSVIYTVQGGSQRTVSLAAPQPTDVTSQVTVVRGGLIFDRANLAARQTLRITNGGQTTISGPIRVVFFGLPTNVSLSNENGAIGTAPVLISAEDLGPASTRTFSVEFNLPAIVPINYEVRVFSGSF